MFGITSYDKAGIPLATFSKDSVAMKVIAAGHSTFTKLTGTGGFYPPNNQPTVYGTTANYSAKNIKSLPIFVAISEGIVGKVIYVGDTMSVTVYSFSPSPVIVYFISPIPKTELDRPPEYGAIIYNENGGVAWHSGIKQALQMVGRFSKADPVNKTVYDFSFNESKTAVMTSGNDIVYSGKFSYPVYYDTQGTVVVRNNTGYRLQKAFLDNVGVPPSWVYPSTAGDSEVYYYILDVSDVKITITK